MTLLTDPLFWVIAIMTIMLIFWVVTIGLAKFELVSSEPFKANPEEVVFGVRYNTKLPFEDPIVKYVSGRRPITGTPTWFYLDDGREVRSETMRDMLDGWRRVDTWNKA